MFDVATRVTMRGTGSTRAPNSKAPCYVVLMQYDFGAFDGEGKLLLVCEAKARAPSSGMDLWASGLRDNLVGRFPEGERAAFLLVTPSSLFFWQPRAPLGTQPHRAQEVSHVLQPYFSRAGAAPASVHPIVFEMIVGSWLSDLAVGKVASELVGTGLPELMIDCRTVSKGTR